jgi:hypothetical protein
MMFTPNPYEVLRLDPSATEEEIVRQAGRLRQRADDAELAAIRQATQALTGRPEERTLHAILAHPKPCYAWPALERFAAAFRRPPQAAAGTIPCPPLDVREVATLLENELAEELEPPPLPFESLPVGDDEEEIERQAAEAVWQSLLYDPRA